MCKAVNAVALIDDSTSYAFGCASAVEKVVLFGDYAWNQTKDELPPNVVRCSTWEQVKAEVGKL